MRFLVITHVAHLKIENDYFAYAPYVREMNIWFKNVDEVEIVAPRINRLKSDIDINYKHDKIIFNKIPLIEFTSIKKIISSTCKLPIIFFHIILACIRADHIHLRCPGNIGLLGCFVQIFFPKKKKTAKYAGNWDPKAKQPYSYRLQKWILSNTFLTKNMQVLVYGNWKSQTKNIKPFFTATYNNSEIENFNKKDYSNHLRFIFIGSLVKGKRPLYVVKLVELLQKQDRNVSLDIYGDGILKEIIQNYIIDNKLQSIVTLHGNQSKEVIKKVLKTSHFSILPSKSEGWPKAIAEAMFFGVIPIATEISCIPYMLDYGNRGILIKADISHDIDIITKAIEAKEQLKGLSVNASKWSQLYTLDKFENEIIKLLNNPK